MQLATLKPRLATLPTTIKGVPVIERKRGNTGIKDRNEIKRRDNGLCQICLRAGRSRMGSEVDHIVPLCVGGSDEASNKELVCRECHTQKTAREASERRG